MKNPHRFLNAVNLEKDRSESYLPDLIRKHESSRILAKAKIQPDFNLEKVIEHLKRMIYLTFVRNPMISLIEIMGFRF